MGINPLRIQHVKFPQLKKKIHARGQSDFIPGSCVCLSGETLGGTLSDSLGVILPDGGNELEHCPKCREAGEAVDHGTQSPDWSHHQTQQAICVQNLHVIETRRSTHSLIPPPQQYSPDENESIEGLCALHWTRR